MKTISQNEFKKLYGTTGIQTLDTSNKNPSYLSRVASSYKQAGQDIVGGIKTSANQINTGVNEFKAGNIDSGLKDVKTGIERAGLRTVGGVASAAFTPITEAIKPLIEPKLQKLAQNPQFQSVINPIIEIANKHPETAKDIGNVIDILTLGAGGVSESAIKDTSVKAGESLSSGVDSVTKAGKDLVNGTSKAGSMVGEVALGTQGQESTIQAFKNPTEVSDFINKRKTLETVANDTRKGVDRIEKASIKQLQKIKDSAPDITIPRTTYINTFKDKILDFVGLDTKSVSKVTDKNLGEFLNQTGFGEQQSGVIKRLSSKIANWKDTSIKGLLDLKSSIAKTGFYKGLPDYHDSDRFVQMVNNHIKELIISKEHGGFAKLAPALENSSKTIDFLDKLKVNLLGKGGDNIESASTKLNTLMTKLADPLQREATINLLEKFKKLTGVDLVNSLNSARAAKTIEAPLSGFKNPLRTAQGLLDRFAGRVAIKAGKIKK